MNDTISYEGMSVTLLVSGFVEGELLPEFLQRQHGKRRSAFPALHLLHALAAGIECIHHS